MRKASSTPSAAVVRVQRFRLGEALTFLWVLLIKEAFWYDVRMETKNSSMIDLPVCVAAYWTAANAGDTAAAAGCFTADATVEDEGKTHRGSAAIAGWVEQTTQSAHPVVEPLRCSTEAGRLLVAAKVSGSFPGSPVELDFEFTLANGKISKLEIK